MKVKLSKAAIQLREQIDDSFPDRDRASDGWIGDTRHAARKSDHNPDEQGCIAKQLNSEGYLCVIARSADEGFKIIEEYLA